MKISSILTRPILRKVWKFRLLWPVPFSWGCENFVYFSYFQKYTNFVPEENRRFQGLRLLCFRGQIVSLLKAPTSSSFLKSRCRLYHCNKRRYSSTYLCFLEDSVKEICSFNLSWRSETSQSFVPHNLGWWWVHECGSLWHSSFGSAWTHQVYTKHALFGRNALD